jgi:hypothetical protein
MPLTVRDKPALFSRGCFFCKPYAMVIWRQLPAHHDAMHKVRRQLPALAALVDLWWQGVRQDLEPFLLAPKWQQWVYECLLPMVYWAHQEPRTRCHRRKAKIQEALKAVRAAFEQHPITQRLAPHVLAEWQAWATARVKVFQRASSAVEGRNGVLSQMHHNQRGLPKQGYALKAGQLTYDCRCSTMHGMPVTGGRGFRGLKPLWYNGVPP